MKLSQEIASPKVAEQTDSSVYSGVFEVITESGIMDMKPEVLGGVAAKPS